MKDPEVHFHVIPRYSAAVVLGGREYSDSDWPLKTELQPLDLSDDELAIIYKKICEVSDES